MAEIREIILAWTIPSGRAARTVLHASAAVSLDTQLTAIRTGFETFKPNLSTTVQVAYPVTCKVYDDATGAYIRDDTAPTRVNTTGGGSAPMPDVVQGLVQLNTATIVGNRRLKGRVYIPGIPASSVSTGNPTATVIAALSQLGTDLGAASVKVWSRPRPGHVGVSAPVSTASGGPEYCVQRRRRNRVTV